MNRNQQQETITSCSVRGSTSVLALNSANNRLIAAGQQNFQLFAIEQIDNIEQFTEIRDFRNGPRHSDIPRYTLQPKDVTWNRNDENSFATASSASGNVYIWDATRLVFINQLNVHNAIINRLQFHPQYANVLLVAYQDGFAKLIDVRINNNDKAITSFRHSSKEGFRDVDINLSNTDKFAAVINDQYSVPIWDIRQPTQPEFSILTRDKVLSIAWNPHERFWLATGGIGGHDRTIRIWDAKGYDNRQEPLFTVYTFGQVTKLSWRPTCPYHIACFTRTGGQRIHVWDVRRAYLPQALFCHHQNDIEDFLWRPNSDNIISVGRDERLIHANISTAIKSEQLVSLFSLNITPKGSVHTSMPNIDNEYVRSLYIEQHIPLSSSNSLQKLYSQKTISTFLKYDKMIPGKTIHGIYSNPLYDNSVQIFHQFARRWIFGNGEKSSKELAYICDNNSIVAEELNRPDLAATWQVIKMLYVNYNHLQNDQMYSSKNSRSLSKSHHTSDPLSGHRYHHHHHSGRKLTNIDIQQQENMLNEELNNQQSTKSEEQRNISDSKLGMIDDADTYIVRDVLTDDLIFITPEDILNGSNGNETLYYNNLAIEIMKDPYLMPLVNTAEDYTNVSLEQFTRQFSEVITIDDDDDDEWQSEIEYKKIDDDTQRPIYAIIPEGSDNFFTIDEGYCPRPADYSVNFDDIIRQTLWYYVENNELQVTVHLLLALYPQLNEYKRSQLFNGSHLQWLIMYIELLKKMRLFIKAKQVIKHCVENEGIPLDDDPSEFDGAIILSTQAPTLKRLPSIVSPSSFSNGKNLSPLLKEFVCSICRIPCRCLFSFCGGCFHGGHIDHMDTWFQKHDECSHGCGHRCRDRDNLIHHSCSIRRSVS